jgi:8-oxo-dGTP pyrophosphatase MutT (NUDIX family)
VCEKPGGGIVDPYFVVEMPASVCAVALTENDEVIMVKQYRHPIEETILELPGGFTDEKETPQQSIARELLEETGYEFSEYTYLAKVAANPGVLNNYTHLFLATGGKKIAEQHLDDNEDIQIELVPLHELKSMLERNEIVQALHISCMHYAFERIGG